MKEYELLMLDWNTQVLEDRILREDSSAGISPTGGLYRGTLIGAGVGTATGVGSQVLSYLYKRRALKQRMNQQCGDNQDCREPFRESLRKLRGEAISSGLEKAIKGFAYGGLAGGAIGTGMQMHKGAENIDQFAKERDAHPYKTFGGSLGLSSSPGTEVPLVSGPLNQAGIDMSRQLAGGAISGEHPIITGIKNMYSSGKASYAAGSPEATEQMRQYFMKHPK